MAKWIQRPPRTAFPESPSTEYHGCLDALIATVREMHLTRDALRDFGYSGPALLVHQDANLAQDRAAICAGMLFDRWIEEVQTECHNCRLSAFGRHEYTNCNVGNPGGPLSDDDPRSASQIF